jgi:hypothetical protein
MYSNGYSNDRSLEKPELVGQSIDRGPSSVVAGVSVDVAGDRDGRMTQQVGDGLDVYPRLERCDALLILICCVTFALVQR